jgi:hypothetical protein
MKQQAIVDIVNDYHPSIMVMQEVTDAGVLFDGIYTGGQQPVPYSLGLNYANLVSDAEAIETSLIAQESDDEKMEGVPAEKEVPHYPLGTEYGMAEGPTYRSGIYRENYGLLFEQAQVVGTPVPYFVRTRHGGYELEQLDEGHVEPFSKESNTRREPLVWQIKLRNSKYSLRSQIPLAEESDPNADEWAEIARERRLEATTTRTIYVMVVHTSPSMNIKYEVQEIMDKAEWLRKNGGEEGVEAAVMVAGDWYMEKADPERFAQYVSGSEGWTTGAARVGPNDVIEETGARPEYGREKVRFLRTNQPGQGVGQAADHYVISEQFHGQSTEMIPAQTRRSSPLTTRQEDRMIDEERDARGWLERGSDHTPVVIYLTVDAIAKPAPPRQKRPRSKQAAPARRKKQAAPARARKPRAPAPRARVKRRKRRND